jgi:HEAT repeat protein
MRSISDDLKAADIVALLEAPVSNRIPLIRWLRREAPEGEIIKALSIAKVALTREILCHLVRKRRIRKAARLVIALLDEPDSALRSAAVWTLGELGETKAGRALLIGFKSEPDPKLRVSYAIALGEIEYRPAVPALVQALQDAEPQLRKYAASSLAGIGTQRAVDAVMKGLKNEGNEDVHKHMRWALTRWKRRQRKAARLLEGANTERA